MSPALMALLAATALPAEPPLPSPPAADAFRPAPAWKPLAPGMWVDPGTRALVLRTRVALRDGPLEHLLCLKGTKEHESVLATLVGPPAREPELKPADPGAPRALSYAEMIRAALTRVVGEPGRPVQFLPEFVPPSGPRVAIELEWQEHGRTRRADAREWVLDERRCTRLSWTPVLVSLSASTAAAPPAPALSLETFLASNALVRLATEPLCLEGRDWVFVGSRHEKVPGTKETFFLADEGDLITVANFASALLDLPFVSSANDAERTFVARGSRIPPRGTGVTIYFRARAAAAPPGR